MLDQKFAFPFFTFDELLEVIRVEESQLPRQCLGIGTWLSVNPDGPLWFRGYATWAEQEGEMHLSPLIAALDVKRIIAAHTPQPDGGIRSRFGGKVFLIDTGMLSSYYPGGKASALEISNTDIRAIYLDKESKFN